MKRQGYLFAKICDRSNIELAYQNARRGKTNYDIIKEMDKNSGPYIDEIQQMLISKTFENSPYTTFRRNERGKMREISRLPFFPDRIIQHAIIQVIEPVLHKTYILDTYASIKGRGIHFGVKRIKKALQDIPGTKYCLKLDIRKFYQSIDNEILKNLLLKIIKDQDTNKLLFQIIDSAKGLPIGNYLSQHLANFYLTYLDHFIKEQLNAKYYFRYCDDLVILHSEKEYLHNAKCQIEKYLNENLNLQLNQNYQVFPVDDRGINYLGYVFFHTHTLIRKSIKAKMIRTIRKNADNLDQSLASYNGWMSHADTFNLRKKYILAA